MVSYLFTRILLFIPTLLIVSVIAFGLGKLAPSDPVQSKIEQTANMMNTLRSQEELERTYKQLSERYNLDKPLFYFALNPAAYPDSLYRILNPDKRITLNRFIGQYGNWPEIDAYYKQLWKMEDLLFDLPSSSNKEALAEIRKILGRLYYSYRDTPILSQIKEVKSVIENDSTLLSHIGGEFNKVAQNYQQIKEQATPYKLYIPDFKWYGFNNQYHNWFVNLFQGDFGYSYQTGQPNRERIQKALKWTLILTSISIFLAFVIAIPIGVFAAVNKASFFDKASTLSLFMLYSLPTFWTATLLVVFLTNSMYGMEWFPTSGVDSGAHFVLPIICLTYGSIAFIARQMRGGMLNVLNQDFIRTARAKGLGETQVIWKHAFRNAIFPIITIFASVLPAAITGSVIIEEIFQIPGMGWLTIWAIRNQDWPLIYAILMLGAIITMVGILLADILYNLFDPRISYKKLSK